MGHYTAILFGLPGVAVERVERVADGDGEPLRLVHAVTAASSSAVCPVCGVAAMSVRQYQSTRPRDLPYGEEPWRSAGTSGSTDAGSRPARGRRSLCGKDSRQALSSQVKAL